MSHHPDEYVLQKYRLQRLLARSSAAEVWQAIEEGFGARPVVIRLPLPSITTGDAADLQRRCERELQVCRTLEQSGATGIVRVLTAEPVPEGQALVTDYLPGGSLAALLHNSPNGVPVEQAVAVTVQVLESLRIAHQHPWEIVHRNITPANILLDAAGNAHVGDWGVAQLAGASQRSRLQAQPHPGTRGYMAPEQANNTQSLTPAADIYAVGCVLFELLTGRPQQSVQNATLRSLYPHVPPALDAIVAKSLAFNPYDRFADAGEMAEAMQQVEIAPLVIPQAQRRSTGRWIAVGLAAAVLLLGAVLFFAQRPQAAAPASSTLTPPPTTPPPTTPALAAPTPTPPSQSADSLSLAFSLATTATEQVPPPALPAAKDTKTAVPTATLPPLATATATTPATETAAETATETATAPVPATATATPEATATPSATATPEATPVPAATTIPSPTFTATPTATATRDEVATIVAATRQADAVAATLTALAPTATPTLEATPTPPPTATATPDYAATQEAESVLLAAAVAATQTASAPTPVPSATVTPTELLDAGAAEAAEARGLAAAVAATLTAVAPTPDLTATAAARTTAMFRSLAATATASAPKPTPTPTVTPTSTPWPTDPPTPLPRRNLRPTHTPYPTPAVYPTDTPPPRRAAERLFFRASVAVRCDNPTKVWFDGLVTIDGQPANGYRVVFKSTKVSGNEPATQPAITGPQREYPGWANGYYWHTVDASAPLAKDKSLEVWIMDNGGNRISDYAYWQTNGAGGGCNYARIDFFAP